jgi:lysophospholipase L1-like esterase
MGTRELSHVALLSALPVVAVQGVRVRRRTPRLPEADGRQGVVGRGPGAIRLTVVGDSVAAGQGVGHHERSVAGELARRLHARHGRPVAWQVVARGGLAAGEVLDLCERHGFGEDGAAPDFVVVSVGVNDTLGMHSDERWTRELRALLVRVRGASEPTCVVLLGVPPIETFPALPRPLAGLLGARARRLDRLGREVVADLAAAEGRLHHVPLRDLDLATAGAYADDGFHPSAALHAELARRIDDLLA